MPPDPFYKTLPAFAHRIDGVFKGGGAAGVAYNGALMALARNGVWFERVAGTSAGAITAALIAAGYDANEIDYIAAPADTRSGPPANLPVGVEPMNYYHLFIDPPVSPSDLRTETKHGNLVYQAIVGSVIDEITKKVIPLPEIDRFIEDVLDEVIKGVPKESGPHRYPLPSFQQEVDLPDQKIPGFTVKVGPYKEKVASRTIKLGKAKVTIPARNVVVGPFPMNIAGIRPLIRRFLVDGLAKLPRTMVMGPTMFGTDELRKLFADAVIGAALMLNPWLTVLLNFFAEGGLVRGNNFLEDFRKLLELRTGRRPTRFCDLPMAFACVACDITAKKMIVYSTMDPQYADMEVAEAVRRSMAIPLFFEPRREGGHEIVDGGTMDNYPIGLFLVKKHQFFSNLDPGGPDPEVHMKRVKFGFSPGTMGMGPGSSLEATIKQILFPSFVPDLPPLPTAEVAFITRVLNIVETNLTDSPLFAAMLDELKDVYRVCQVAIKGEFGPFATFNFDITKPRFKMMCSQGWTAGLETLDDAVLRGFFPRLMVGDRANPY